MNERKIDQKFAVIAYVAALLISTVATGIVASAVDQTGNLYLYLCYLLPQIGYISVFSVMCKMRKVPFSELIKKENIKGSHYLYGVIVAVGLLFFALLPNNFIMKFFAKIGSSATAVVPKFNGVFDYILSGLIICVLPAIGEELIFRKAFCDGMSEVSEIKTVLLCGLAFALSHLNLAQTVHQFVLGVCLGYIYVKTKNITVTMVMHFINNVLALYLESITGPEVWNNITVLSVSCAIGFVLTAAGLFLFYKKCKKLDREKKGSIDTIMTIFIVVLALAWAIMAGLSFVN